MHILSYAVTSFKSQLIIINEQKIMAVRSVTQRSLIFILHRGNRSSSTMVETQSLHMPERPSLYDCNDVPTVIQFRAINLSPIGVNYSNKKEREPHKQTALNSRTCRMNERERFFRVNQPR